MSIPELHREQTSGYRLRMRHFYLWFLSAMWHGAVMYAFGYLAVGGEDLVFGGSMRSGGLNAFGFFIVTGGMISVHLKLALALTSWTWLMQVLWIGT